MKKILVFIVVMALMCLVGCTEKNVPGEAESNTAAGAGDTGGDSAGGGTDGSSSQNVLLTLSTTSWTEYTNSPKGNSKTIYEYNGENDVVKESMYSNGELYYSNNYSWTGNKKIGLGEYYNAGTVYGHVYDTTDYVDSKHVLYSRLSTRYVYSDSENWGVNSYEYNNGRLLHYTYYQNGALTRDMEFTYSGDKRYGKETQPTSSFVADRDTSTFLPNGLIAEDITWITQTTSKYVTRIKRTFLPEAFDVNQMTRYEIESVYYDVNGKETSRSGQEWTYTWKGDSVRYGYAIIYVNGSQWGTGRDTTRYCIVKR